MLGAIENMALREYVRSESQRSTPALHEVERELIEFDSRFEAVIKNYDATSLNRTILSTTGIALGHAHAKNILGHKFTDPLDFWLSSPWHN
jgi:hypothetical protein